MKITKALATETAEKMASKIWDEGIKVLEDNLHALGYRISEKYIPANVRNCFVAYPSYFSQNSMKHLYVVPPSETPRGLIHGPGRSIKLNLDKSVPYKSGSYEVSLNDYNLAWDLTNRLDGPKGKRYCKAELIEELTENLRALSTLERVTAEFPEALPFITVQEKQLPALKLDALKELFKP